ncbi:MAG: hypothetical protein HONBIEJF_02322 [Fimbriimonadaceae bacterium]|nr:hypothetical protein [Fimbriimonadaceae bacterium]
MVAHHGVGCPSAFAKERSGLGVVMELGEDASDSSPLIRRGAANALALPPSKLRDNSGFAAGWMLEGAQGFTVAPNQWLGDRETFICKQRKPLHLRTDSLRSAIDLARNAKEEAVCAIALYAKRRIVLVPNDSTGFHAESIFG